MLRRIKGGRILTDQGNVTRLCGPGAGGSLQGELEFFFLMFIGFLCYYRQEIVQRIIRITHNAVYSSDSILILSTISLLSGKKVLTCLTKTSGQVSYNEVHAAPNCESWRPGRLSVPSHLVYDHVKWA